MEISSKEKPKNLWKNVDPNKYLLHVTVSYIRTIAEPVHLEDLEKRRVYGVCGECNEPGTGERWCQPCNAKRFKENFKNWTSRNKDIDELIQHSQLNAVHWRTSLEWVPFEKFQNVTYITKGGFGKIYLADWPEGFIWYWDIENQKWHRYKNYKVALKSLDNSSDICADFLNEVKSYLQIYLNSYVKCFGITQDPDTKDYMMVLNYCKNGNLRDYMYHSENYITFQSKIDDLLTIATGLKDIHHVEKVHRDFHSGNILFNNEKRPRISDLGMCQPANQSAKKEGIYGVLPYMAPEVLCGHQYTKAADIYSFGIVMNEFISEETPYDDIPHDHALSINICKGLRPKISEDTPKLLADLITKCWDAEAENRPTALELLQVLRKWNGVMHDGVMHVRIVDDEIYSQGKEYDRIRENKLRSNKSKPKNIPTHPQAFYTSRLLNFKNLPKPVNSSDLSSSKMTTNKSDVIPSTTLSENLISQCLDCELSEADLIDEIDQNNNQDEE